MTASQLVGIHILMPTWNAPRWIGQEVAGERLSWNGRCCGGEGSGHWTRSEQNEAPHNLVLLSVSIRVCVKVLGATHKTTYAGQSVPLVERCFLTGRG